MRLAIFACLALSLISSGAWARSPGDCWLAPPGAPQRPEVTCQPITERLLIQLENATEMQAQSAMHADGMRLSNGLHFMSNYLGLKGRTGDVTLRIESGRVTIIEAVLDPDEGEKHPLSFIWNSKLGSCSDFPNSQKRCDN